MAVTQTDTAGLTRAQRFASLLSSGHINAFFVSERLNKLLAELCCSTESEPIAYLTIVADQETGDLLWLDIDPTLCVEDEVVVSYKLELKTSYNRRNDYLSSPIQSADMTCRLTVNDVEVVGFTACAWIRGSVVSRGFATSSYSHSQIHHEVLRCHFNYLRRDPDTHWAAEELEDL